MKKEISSKIPVFTFSVLAVLFLTVFYISAWEEPSGTPPTQNTTVIPVNVSTITQTLLGSKRIDRTNPSDILSLGTGFGVDGVLRSYGSLVATGNSTNPVAGACPIGYEWYDDGDGVLENGECMRTSIYTTLSGNLGIGTTTPNTGRLVVSGGNIDVANNRIINVAAPSDGKDAVNKAYVDAATKGIPTEIENTDRAADTFLNAITICRNLGNGWHLPTVAELRHFAGISGGTQTYLWTKDVSPSGVSYKVTIRLSDGEALNGPAGTTQAFRCVR